MNGRRVKFLRRLAREVGVDSKELKKYYKSVVQRSGLKKMPKVGEANKGEK